MALDEAFLNLTIHFFSHFGSQKYSLQQNLWIGVSIKNLHLSWTYMTKTDTATPNTHNILKAPDCLNIKNILRKVWQSFCTGERVWYDWKRTRMRHWKEQGIWKRIKSVNLKEELTWFGSRFSGPIHRHFDGFIVSGHLNWRWAHDYWQRKAFTLKDKSQIEMKK